MNLNSKLLITWGMLLWSFYSNSQSIDNYKIIYEKRVNLAKLFPNWRIYNKEDKFHKESFILQTNSINSFYERQEKDITEERSYLSSFMTYSNTFIDIKNKFQTSQKEVGEKTFLMKDSLPNIEWRIYDETRNIAGYTCHKAMARYADSIVIVAFFTEQLGASIGPESINGLPGTILGLVIPKLETTWLATSVESLEQHPVKSFTPPTKGEIVNVSKLRDLVKKVYKDYMNAYSIIYRVIL